MNIHYLAKELIYKHYGNNLYVGGTFEHPDDGPIRIFDGQFMGEYGLSNFWWWKVLETGEKKKGYGGRWKEYKEE